MLIYQIFRFIFVLNLNKDDSGIAFLVSNMPNKGKKDKGEKVPMLISGQFEDKSAALLFLCFVFNFATVNNLIY